MSTLGKCVLLALSIILVEGYPAQTDENCLKINPDIQKQIDDLVEQISKNIINISANYDDIDLRLLEISMDRHFSEESEKNTVVQITINDCMEGVSHTQYNTDNKQENTPTAEGKGDESADVESQKDNDATIKSNDLNVDDNILNDSKNETITNDKSDVPSEELPDKDDTNKDDIKNNNKEISNSENKDVNPNINKDSVPDVLEFVNYNDIREGFFNNQTNIDSNESLVLNDNDKIFFEALTKVRGTEPFIVYQRRYNDSEQYWFL